MQEMFSHFPELLLIDATYKLNDLRMPLYIMMVVDGNGESEIVALWIVASEDRISIKNMVHIFKRHNSTDKTVCIMSDKDMTERDVLSEEIPNAVLQICLFHTLRSFKREISTEKLHITSDQRQMTLEIITKLVYSKNETEYQQHYQELIDTKLKPVIDYFNKNWHAIRAEWVEGLKNNACNFLNRTNNRLEAINQKIKSVVQKYSSLVKFFQDLLKCLDSLALERDHRAITIFQKAPVQLYTSESALYHYQLLLTPYAFSFLKEQLKAKKISEDAGTAEINVLQSSEGLLVVSALRCQCSFFKAMKLPCRHVFSHRITHNMELFDKNICAARWTKNYYHESHRVFSSDSVQNIGIPVQVSDIQRTSSRILSQHEKYRKAFGIAQKLASLASEIPMKEYHYALECLQKIVEMWEKGKHVAVKIIDADQNARMPPCQSQPPVTMDMHSTTSNSTLDAEHHGHTLQLPPLHSQPPVTSDMPPTTSRTPLTHLSPNQSQPSTKSTAMAYEFPLQGIEIKHKQYKELNITKSARFWQYASTSFTSSSPPMDWIMLLASSFVAINLHLGNGCFPKHCGQRC